MLKIILSLICLFATVESWNPQTGTGTIGPSGQFEV